MTPLLQIRLLGGVEICLGDRTAGNFVSSKAPALVAFLAVTKRPHHRDALAALLWGEMGDADAKINLRQTLTSLRKELEPWLVITRETVQLNPSAPLLIDVALFEEHLKAGRDVDAVTRAHALHAAVQLYHGDFLAGFFVRDAPDFEEWMLAHSGQRSAALSQYSVCRQLPDKELGVAPSAETTALYERIRAAGAEVRHNLPLPRLLCTSCCASMPLRDCLRRSYGATEGRHRTGMGRPGGGTSHATSAHSPGRPVPMSPAPVTGSPHGHGMRRQKITP